MAHFQYNEEDVPIKTDTIRGSNQETFKENCFWQEYILSGVQDQGCFKEWRQVLVQTVPDEVFSAFTYLVSQFKVATSNLLVSAVVLD